MFSSYLLVAIVVGAEQSQYASCCNSMKFMNHEYHYYIQYSFVSIDCYDKNILWECIYSR